MKPNFMSAKIRLVLLQTETSVVDLNVWNVTQAEGVFSHTSSCASVLSRGFSRTSDGHEKKLEEDVFGRREGMFEADVMSMSCEVNAVVSSEI